MYYYYYPYYNYYNHYNLTILYTLTNYAIMISQPMTHELFINLLLLFNKIPTFSIMMTIHVLRKCQACLPDNDIIISCF